MNLLIHIANSIAQRRSLRSLLAFLHFSAAITVFAQPANDNPCNAVVLAPNLSCTNTPGTLAAATPTPSIPAPGCANYVGGDVWYRVTVPASGQITVTTSQQGGGINTGMAFYTAAACTGPFSLVSCNDDIIILFNQYSRLVYNGAPGTIIYVRVWRFGSNGAGSFNICATAPPAPLANDGPCTATPLTVTANCGFTAFTNVGATNNSSYPAPGCGNFGAGSLDVWFRIVAPASGIAIIETTAGTLTDGAMALYAATSCNGPFTLVNCNDDGGAGLMPFLSFTGLTPGVTYYLRYWGFGTGAGTFNLCVHGPTSIPAGQCVYLLQLNDGGNNGWGSSSVNVSINGGPFTNYTVTGTYGVVLIGLNIGNVIVLQYVSTGPNQGQNSYTLSLLNGGGNIFSSGTPPASGIVYSQTVTCQPPPAPSNDCVGGTTVCGAQSFNNNSSGTGNAVDLNAGNQGCLASGERQGTWYRFSPSLPGNVGFTIAVGATDYDFAVWGPMSSVQCPPVGPPLRCSYSALTGNTGIGNSAADPTEGAGGDKWVSLIPVLAGQIYILYIDNFSANGQAFSLSWQLTNGAALDCTVLPIDLTSFTAEPKEDHVLLKWTTASEENNDHFDVERSSDGVQFNAIGSLIGSGTSATAAQYMLPDRAPLNGLNYYRLKQVDLDGQFEYSDISTAFFRQKNGPLTMVPNPGNSSVRVLLPQKAGAMIVQVIDATGRVVLAVPTSEDQVQLCTVSLSTGLYSIQALTSEGLSVACGTWIKE